MQKEVLTLEKIAKDLRVVAKKKMEKISEWRFLYIFSFTLFAICIGAFFNSIWIGILIFSVAAYHIVRYVMEYRAQYAIKKSIKSLINRGEISISVENFSHFGLEYVHEPRVRYVNGRAVMDLGREVKFMFFMSGTSWRVPIVKNHYAWSKEYYVSTEGLDNISLQGDEFYYVTLQGDYDISYVYPCKFFTLDSSLKRDEPQ